MFSEDTFDGDLVEAFPGLDLPAKPTDMRMTPDGKKWWIVGQLGEIVQVSRKSSCWHMRAVGVYPAVV